MLRNQIEYLGRKINLIWHDETDFEKLDNVTQAYGFVFNDKGELLIISSSEGKTWSPPGGTPEDYEDSFKETLKREIIEEADVKIKDIVPLGYQEAIYLDNKTPKVNQLRYFARVKEVMPQTIDPAQDKILLRKFIKPEEFNEYANWGEIGEHIVRKAKEIFEGEYNNS